MTLEVTHPWRLLLLTTVPVVWWIVRRTLTDFAPAQLGVLRVLRSLIVVLLVLALAGVVLTRPSSRTAVIALVDMSPSVSDEATSLATQLVERIQAETDRVIPVGFDNAAHVELLFAGRSAASGTDIAGALRFARARLPAEYVGRVLLLSDGHATTSGMFDEAARLKTHGIELIVAGLPAATGPEVIAQRLDLSGTPTPGATVEVVAHVASSGETTATVDLFVDGFRLGASRPVTLARGDNRVTSAVRLPKGGSHEYAVVVTSPDDTFAGNNRAAAVVVLPAEMRVLVIEGRDEDARYLVRALREADIDVDVRTADGFPTGLVELDRYACVVFADVAATSLTPAQMRMLRTYVEDLGGGFVMTGGEDSFGLGGYFRTPVEAILPVRLDVEKKKESPTVAMMLLLDKSGSMRGKKVRLAKEAAAATLSLLGAEDRVGVVSFDTQAYEVSPLVKVSKRSTISGTIASITAGGGTNMFPALESAHRTLTRAKARVKHVILLTDGKTHDGDYSGLVRRMASERMTVSCVAVGDGADVTLLRNVARWGRGRFYFTRDALSIPQIFARETVTAAQSAVVEEPFRPRVVRDVELLRGLDFGKCPYLLGYVATRAKATGEVILASERSEPLLARWRIGLGRTAAWTCDVTNRWSVTWLSWSGFGKFWAQVIRSVSRTRAAGTFDVRLAFEDGAGVLTLNAVDAAGRFRNRTRASASVFAPGGGTLTCDLAQEAPGRYRGRFDAATPGTYVASVQLAPFGSADAGDVVVAAAVKPPPAEFVSLDVDRDALRQLAAAAGGTFVAPEDWTTDLAVLARAVAEPSSRRVAVTQPLRSTLLWTALALFFVDLACRRIDFTAIVARRARTGASLVLVVLLCGVAAAAPHDARSAYLEAKRADVLQHLVRTLLSQKKLNEARTLLAAERKRIVETVPKGTLDARGAQTLCLLGIVEEMSGDAVARDARFAEAWAWTSPEAAVCYTLGETFERWHREDVAVAAFERVLALEPAPEGVYHQQALLDLARIAYTNREWTRAAAYYGRLVDALRGDRRQDRDERFTRFLGGVKYLHDAVQGHALLSEDKPDAWAQALTACERAWAQSSERIDAPVLGERIARVCPDRARAAALATQWRQRSERLAEVLRGRIRAEPHDAGRYNALAWFLAERDSHHDEAVRLAKRACELDPGEPAYIDTLAECQFRKGDVVAAVATIRRVIDVHPWATGYYRRQLERFEAALKTSGKRGDP